MTSYRTDKGSYVFLSVLALYGLAYYVARSEVLHAVEHYAGGKGSLRQDYIAKKNHAPGEGWEYKVFFPAIKVEENVRKLGQLI